MTSPNLSHDMTEMLIAKGYQEDPSDNKQWRIFFQPNTPETRWFVHEGGKVRRGKSVHKSTAITQEARRMLGRYWLEKKKTGKQQRQNAVTVNPSPDTRKKKASNPQTTADIICQILSRPDGATVEEIAAATGWQKHSVRGFLSTQKKKRPDFTLEKFTRGDGKTAYKLEVELS